MYLSALIWKQSGWKNGYWTKIVLSWWHSLSMCYLASTWIWCVNTVHWQQVQLCPFLRCYIHTWQLFDMYVGHHPHTSLHMYLTQGNVFHKHTDGAKNICIKTHGARHHHLSAFPGNVRALKHSYFSLGHWFSWSSLQLPAVKKKKVFEDEDYWDRNVPHVCITVCVCEQCGKLSGGYMLPFSLYFPV